DTRGDRLFLGETFCRWRIDGALRLAQRQIRSLVAGHSALSRRHVSRSRCREGKSRHESDNGNGQDRHRRFEQSCDIELRVIERKAPWEPRSFTELIVNAVRARFAFISKTTTKLSTFGEAKKACQQTSSPRRNSDSAVEAAVPAAIEEL